MVILRRDRSWLIVWLGGGMREFFLIINMPVRYDLGLCKSANEDHARDLPMMNGVKEEIKIIGVMNVGSPDYQEALTRLLSRLNKLKVGFSLCAN